MSKCEGCPVATRVGDGVNEIALLPFRKYAQSDLADRILRGTVCNDCQRSDNKVTRPVETMYGGEPGVIIDGNFYQGGTAEWIVYFLRQSVGQGV